ncbi:hypothetical protein GIB67_038822 [Kingdonia uniflora]|uniref:Thylakoid lumenal 17.9 kDa protein, chloroplastic n=1 Tax=Kingdonia uniflora TaxID=39325 RepID=A0A7J7M0U2_9MAGN|nr:hypothetical protein GIB67_038822 [Kingdonia uniflora]
MSVNTLLFFPPFPKIFALKQSNPSNYQTPTASFQESNIKNVFFSNLVSLAVAVTLTSSSPSLALPSLNYQTPLPSSTTPFSQSKDLPIGLENGKIRPCPSTNPSCITTNPQSSSFTFPWVIPDKASGNAVQKLQEAILSTQKNSKIQVIQDTPNGQYVQAEVDGGFGRDVLEFLVKGDVVVYRFMATKVTYVYPFTTALGDSRGQEERMKKILDQLGWQVVDVGIKDCFPQVNWESRNRSKA